MGKRYGQRPSSLLPMEVFKTDYERFFFDLNTMLLGVADEIKSHDEAAQQRRKGVIATRREAFAAARRAKQAAFDMDIEANG